MGGLVVGVRGEVDSELGVLGGVTLVAVDRTAAMVAAGVIVVGGCVVVVVVAVVVVAAWTVGGTGVVFLVGGGMVGVGGLNLMIAQVNKKGKKKTRKKGNDKIRIKQMGMQIH